MGKKTIDIGTKVNVLTDIAKMYDLHVFIETGTWHGWTTERVAKNFRVIHTIELHDGLASEAAKKFKNDKHIIVHHGDSGKLLGGILNLVDERSLIYLDAHFSRCGTAKGDKETPIENELIVISKQKVRDHVIIIDDARYFNGKMDYPTFQRVFDMLHAINPAYSVTIDDRIDAIIAAVPML